MVTVKLALGERVSDVRASQRLTNSAACLVAGGKGPDCELERLLARATMAALGTKPILELNMRHILVKALARAVLFLQACRRGQGRAVGASLRRGSIFAREPAFWGHVRSPMAAVPQ
jgi:hypothetical protein